MKLMELLLNEAVKLTVDQFKIEKNGDGFKISVAAKSGPLVSAIRSLAYALSPYSDFDGEEHEDDIPYDKFTKTVGKLAKKLHPFTVAGKAIKSTSFDKFKASSFVINVDGGTEADIKVAIKAVVEYKNSELESAEKHKASAPERKKTAAKRASSDQKAKREKLEAKYGKKTIDRVKYRQIGGDDGYQYNIIVDGNSVMNGLTLSSAKHEQERIWKIIAKRDKVGTYGAI